MTQAALAEASGVAQPTIWRLVNGNAKGSSKLVDIANALAVNIDWLANGVGDMESPNSTPQFRADRSLEIPVWDENGYTGDAILSPVGAPAGSIAIVDTHLQPGTDDLVIAQIGNSFSVYKFLEGGTQGFLAVDDSRVPLIDISSSVLLGVVVFLVRDFRR